ncbi:hypothetical protein HDV02_002691, partial [Globomyces sp. JEL0801]
MILKTIKLKLKLIFKKKSEIASNVVKRISSRQSMMSLKEQAPPAKTLLDLQDTYVDEHFKLSPVFGTIFDYPKYLDDLYDDSVDAWDNFAKQVESIEKELLALDTSSFTEQEYKDYEFMKATIQVEKSSWQYRPLNVLPNAGNFGGMIHVLQSTQPLKTEDDYQHFELRLKKVSASIDSSIKLLEQGINDKVTLNEATVDKFVKFLAQLTGADIASHMFNRRDELNTLGKAFAFDEIILNSVNPALEKLRTFLDTTYRPHCRTSFGIFDLPDSQKVYQELIYSQTTTRYTAAELHELGLKEVERIKARMEQVKDLIYVGPLSDFRKDLNDSEKFPEARLPREKVIPFVEELLKGIDEKLPKLFSSFPAAKCQVKAVDAALEDVNPMAYYDLTKAEFYVNLKLCDNEPLYTLTALVLHEANPGHHHQIALQKEKPSSHLVEQLSLMTSYVEGWGLYSEYLGEELAVYKDALALYGRLELEMVRAVRLVVDTGLHGFGWDYEKSLAYFLENVSTLGESAAISEIHRYSNNPGQALAYKVGELKILELRKYAQEALRSQFDIKEFHRVVLANGSIPLDRLELFVREWVDTTLATPLSLVKIQDSLVYDVIESFPKMAVMFDYDNFHTLLEDVSISGANAFKKKLTTYLTDLESLSYESIPSENRAAYLNLKSRFAIWIELWNNNTEFPCTHLSGFAAKFIDEFAKFQPLENIRDVLNYQQRLRNVPKQFEDTVERLKLGITNKRTLPKESILSLIEGLTAVLEIAPEDSRLNLKSKLEKLPVRQDLFHDAISTLIYPALESFKTFLEVEYLANARPNPGLYGMANAEEIYASKIFESTTIQYSSEELHQIGLKEVERISNRMEQVKNLVFDGSLAEFRDAIKDKVTYPQLYLGRDETIANYKKLMEEIDAVLPKYFNKFPKAKCEVLAVEKDAEATSAIAFYMPGYGDKPGSFYANLQSASEKPLQDAVALVLHEAMPGWGLYAEFLGEEMGMYKDPLTLFGRLEMEMHRSIRLVVDTGLHAKGWSVERCVEYLLTHCTMPEKEALSEIKRYCVWPGQALSYKVGEIKIREVRAYAEEKLGCHFDIKEFHDIVLERPVTLAGLTTLIEDWVTSKLAQPKTLKDLQDEYVDIMFQSNPVYGEMYGYSRFRDFLFDESLESIDGVVERLKALLKETANLDITAFNSIERTDYQNLKGDCEREILSIEAIRYVPLNQMFVNMALIEMLEGFQPLATANDVLNYESRLKLLPAVIDNYIVRFQRGIEANITLAEDAILGSISALEGLISQDPSKSRYNLEGKLNLEIFKSDYFHSLISDQVNPALQKLKEFLQQDYLPHARQSAGISGWNNSDQMYKDAIFVQTTYRHDPEELHQLGLQEVERIYARMEAVKDLIFDGSVAEFMVSLKDKEKYSHLYFNRETTIPFYEDILTKINEKLPEFFETIPDNPCNIKAVPESAEGSAPLAYYLPGSKDTPGAFIANLSLSMENPLVDATALVLHEANPGHHYQFGLAKDAEVSHLINKMRFLPAYMEGWGLYCEYLGEEMGMYKDPFSLFGRLQMEMTRALRLVVDTGLNYFNWDKERAVTLMQKYLTSSKETLEKEVDRYCAMPGQALRGYAERKLEHLFDLKQFHSLILDNGVITLEGLELNVREWVAEKLSRPTTLVDLQDSFVYKLMRNQPTAGDLFKYPHFRDQLDQSSVAECDKYTKFLEEQLVEAEEFERSGVEYDREELQALKSQLKNNILPQKFSLEVPMTQFFGSIISLPQSFDAYQRFESTNDFLNYKNRLTLIPNMIEGDIERLQVGISNGYTLNKESIELIIKSLANLITENPADSSFNLYSKWSVLGIRENALFRTITEMVNPAILKLKTYFETEYLPNARSHPGLFGIPNYVAIYELFSRFHTTSSYTSDELHNLGLAEVERIAARMEDVKNKVFDGTLKEFQESLANKDLYPQLYVSGRDQEIDAVLPKYFNEIPSTVCGIHAVPAQAEVGSPMAFYMPGNKEIPGKFMVNLSMYEDKPLQQATALILHEAMPGHHLQLSLVNEKEQHLIRKFDFYTAYIEGWGLYAEYLGEEMGLYEDPLALYGRLELEMHRALRLVVDTGLHVKGWSIEQSVELLKKYLTLNDSEIVSEVKRYCAMPGQALAYKVGELKIRELRAYAEKELGEKFHIGDFHDLVLNSGSVPLDVLEFNVKNW